MLHGLSLVVASRGSSLSRCSAQASPCRGFFSCRARAPGRLGFSSCSSWAAGNRFSSCGSQAQLLHSMWDPLRSGIDPMPPALAAEFFTAEPPGETPGFFVGCTACGILVLRLASIALEARVVTTQLPGSPHYSF